MTAGAAKTLGGTGRLTDQGDFAERMVAGIGAFLDRALEEAEQAATERLARPPASPAEHRQETAAKRERLAQILGAVDARSAHPALELVARMDAAPVGRAALRGVAASLAAGDSFGVYAVRWPALDGVDGEGLLLQPAGPVVADVVALPDADWTPEQVAGVSPGPAQEGPFGRRLAALGCRVVVPALLDRRDTWSGNPLIRMTNQPHREFVYRMAYQMGRHVIGYEVQKVLALVDWFWGADGGRPRPPVGVFGYGEGGLLALAAAALDERVTAAGVSGYFRNRRQVWREPTYRNVWRLLRGFGDAELAAMIAPRGLLVEAADGPLVEGPPPEREGRRGGAPGALSPIPPAEIRSEIDRARPTYAGLHAADRLVLVEPGERTAPGTNATLRAFLRLLGVAPARRRRAGPAPARVRPGSGEGGDPQVGARDSARASERAGGDPDARQRRQLEQMCDYTQRLVRLSYRQRDAFWRGADPSSVETWQQTCSRYRDALWDEVIGRLPAPSVPADPRTRLAYDEPSWTGYEVTLDLWPDVFAYGVLLLPKDLRPGERRPVVVCQHGLEGRPADLVEREGRPYEQFARRLVERGYVVYAPQNPYVGGDSFRWLQRKANPLGWSLFSFIVAQHARLLDWLATLPFVDAEQVALYGLSYGGKTAMRVPALLNGADGKPGYCLSICSGDFNEWIVKCAGTDLQMSYMFTAEWEMFDFNLGHTFNYAEMAYLIAPRPFMVERGHRDGVALDEWVSFEYAKVRRRYADLKMADRTEIAYFDGPHTIDGTATFPFLDKHLHRTARTAPGSGA